MTFRNNYKKKIYIYIYILYTQYMCYLQFIVNYFILRILICTKAIS